MSPCHPTFQKGYAALKSLGTTGVDHIAACLFYFILEVVEKVGQAPVTILILRF